MKAGSEVLVRIVSPALNMNDGAPLPAEANIATVTGKGFNGTTILQTPAASFYIKQAAEMPVGSSWIIEIEPKTNTPSNALLTVPDNNPTSPAIQDIIQTLSQIDPHIMQNILTNNIPQPNAALPTTLLLFLSAMGKSNPRFWLNEEATNKLTKAGKSALIAKLSEEIKSQSKTVQDPVVGEWKSYPVPIYADANLQMLNFYVHQRYENSRDHEETSSPANGNVATVRFVIDLRMSQLGPLQLDGLVHRKQIDLILRSEHALPETLTQDLHQTYIKALGNIDYAGTIMFQTGRQGWLVLRNTHPQAIVT